MDDKELLEESLDESFVLVHMTGMCQLRPIKGEAENRRSIVTRGCCWHGAWLIGGV